MPQASIIVPAYNVERTITETIKSLLVQTFYDFEIIIVDDGSTDETVKLIENLQTDPRIRLVLQRNRGLAGARNTGIHHAKGDLIGFCDADDIWEPNKLETHVAHLNANKNVGISFSGSTLIDNKGRPLNRKQSPRLHNIQAHHIFKRNPIGNGSSAIIRKSVFQSIAYRPPFEQERDWVFDESFRQSEDIECWTRIALTTTWEFEGVKGHLTQYRINSAGLSANTDQQLAAWERMVSKLRPINPDFFNSYEKSARAYQYRYLARRAVSDLNGDRACELMKLSLRESARPLFEEPLKTVQTMIAALVLRIIGRETLQPLLVARGHQ